MKTTNEMIDDLNNLIKVLDIKSATNPNTEVFGLNVTTKSFLTETSLAALEKKSYHLTEMADGIAYRCIFLTVQTLLENLDMGLKAICDDLNALSEKGLIHSTLLEPSYVHLARSTLSQGETVCVVCYILVPSSKMDEVKSLIKYDCEEGEISATIGNLEAKIPEGEFLAKIEISVIDRQINLSNSLDSAIDEYLRVLPKGTEVVSKTQMHIAGLSVPFEVRFRNPLMKDFKRVELEKMRCCVLVDSEIKVFDLITKVIYTRHDGSKTL